MLSIVDNFLKKNNVVIFFFLYFCYLYHDLTYGTHSSTFFYFSFSLFILTLPLINERIPFDLSWVDFIPLSILFSAAAGVLIAFSHHIEPLFILRNSVGLFMFVFYFVFALFLRPEYLFKNIKNISILANLFILASLLFRGEFYILGIGTQRFMYSPLLVFAFVIYPFLLNQLFDDLFISKSSLSKIIFNSMNLGIVFFNVYLVSLSKGALLGILMISILYLFLKFYHTGKSSTHKTMLLFSVAFVTFIVSLKTGVIDRIFGMQDAGNQSRFLQNQYLYRETSFWGNGLGSYLLNGFYRDDTLKYAYESTFFNFWNKLGVFWFLILASYAYSVYLLFKKRTLDSRSLIYMGTLFYILISLGNPTLFGPSYVILACLGLNLIRNDFTIKKNALELK